MHVLFVILALVVALSCVAVNVLILLQKKRTAGGLSGAMAGMGAAQTYADKNKGRTLEGQLERYTKILGAVFMVVSLALNIVF